MKYITKFLLASILSFTFSTLVYAKQITKLDCRTAELEKINDTISEKWLGTETVNSTQFPYKVTTEFGCPMAIKLYNNSIELLYKEGEKDAHCIYSTRSEKGNTIITKCSSAADQ